MESRVSTIVAYDKKCIGCQRFGASIMISFQTKQGGDITDLFLDEAQAERFYRFMTDCMTRNAEETDDKGK